MIDTEQVTIRDVIRNRAVDEKTMYTQSQPQDFRGLIPVSNQEKRDIQDLDSSQTIGYFILVDDQQVESLDEVVQVGDNTEIEVVKVLRLLSK